MSALQMGILLVKQVKDITNKKKSNSKPLHTHWTRALRMPQSGQKRVSKGVNLKNESFNLLNIF